MALHGESWQVRAKIVCGEYDMPDVLFQHVPSDAKDFISKLLVVDPAQRMSAEQALAHPWLRRSTRYLYMCRPLILQNFSQVFWRAAVGTKDIVCGRSGPVKPRRTWLSYTGIRILLLCAESLFCCRFYMAE